MFYIHAHMVILFLLNSQSILLVPKNQFGRDFFLHSIIIIYFNDKFILQMVKCFILYLPVQLGNVINCTRKIEKLWENG